MEGAGAGVEGAGAGVELGIVEWGLGAGREGVQAADSPSMAAISNMDVKERVTERCFMRCPFLVRGFVACDCHNKFPVSMAGATSPYHP